jgi:DNA-binding NarL/FixJ family response regulator
VIADEVLLVVTDSRAEDLVTAALDGHVEPRVTTGAGALDSLHEQEMDALILTDRLAATDAIDCIRDIRREFPSLPMVLVSDSDSGVLASDALAAGADDYVPLPVVPTDPDRLRLGLDRAVRARSLSAPSEELAALYTATREVIEADSAADLAERVIGAGADVLAPDYACVYRFDSDGDQLPPVVWTEQLETAVEDLPPLATGSLAWPAFVNSSTKYHADVSTIDREPTQGTTLRTELFVPPGDYGLLCVPSPAPAGRCPRAEDHQCPRGERDCRVRRHRTAGRVAEERTGATEPEPAAGPVRLGRLT